MFLNSLVLVNSPSTSHLRAIPRDLQFQPVPAFPLNNTMVAPWHYCGIRGTGDDLPLLNDIISNYSLAMEICELNLVLFDKLTYEQIFFSYMILKL